MKKTIPLQTEWQTEIFSGGLKNFDLPLLLPAETIGGQLIFKHGFCIPENDDNDVYYLTLDSLGGDYAVLIDGRIVARHSGMFAPFSCDISSRIQKGKRQTIRIALTPKASPAGFFTFGGAQITCVNRSHFDLSAPASLPLVCRTEFEGNLVHLFIDTHIVQPNNYDILQYVLTRPDGTVLATQTAKPTSPQACLTFTAPILWDGTGGSYRYRLVAAMFRDNVEIDRTETSFGLRNIEIGSNGIFSMNGIASPLCGVSLPPERYDERNLALLTDLGCNCVLLETVSPGEAFLNFCDERGILVFFMFPFSDLPGGKEELLATVRMLHKHPSVCFYGYRAEDVNLAKSFVTAVQAAKANVFTVGNTNILYQESFSDSFSDILLIDVDFDHESASQTDFENRYLDVCKDHPDYRFAVFAQPPAFIDSENNTPDAARKYEEAFLTWHEKCWAMFSNKKNVIAYFAGALFDKPIMNAHPGLIAADRDDKKDAFWFYKANLSAAPTLHLCFADHVYTTDKRVSLKCYTNEPALRLFVRGKETKKNKYDSVSEHVGVFHDIKLRKGNNTVIVSSGALADSTVLRRKKRYTE